MTDLIKREDAIDEIRKESQELHSVNVIPLATVGAMVDAIVRVPAVEPKQGEWMFAGNNYDMEPIWECSKCGEKEFGSKSELTKYCPECGARMK